MKGTTQLLRASSKKIRRVGLLYFCKIYFSMTTGVLVATAKLTPCDSYSKVSVSPWCSHILKMKMDFYFINSNNYFLKLPFICFLISCSYFSFIFIYSTFVSLFSLVGSYLLYVLYWYTSVWLMSLCASVWIFFNGMFLNFSPGDKFFLWSWLCSPVFKQKMSLVQWKTPVHD